MEFLEPYRVTALVLGLTGLLYWLQLAIADIVGIRAKHTPGFTIDENHNSFLFRCNRALANSNESVGIFILFTIFALLSSANAAWLNGFAVVHLIGRTGHMLFYYRNLQLLRSAAFAIGFLGLLGIFIVGLLAWL